MEYRGPQFRAIKSTCKGCEERYPGCHDHCESYQDAREEWSQRQKDIRKNKRLYKEFDHYKVEEILRSKYGK